MTEIEALKKRIQELESGIAEADKSSRVYLQNVSHQLTAPLGAIKWSIEALRDPEVPFQRKTTLLSSVYSQATILVHLIKNFALMSNLDADQELGQMRNQEKIDPMLLAINLTNDFQPQATDQGKKKIVVDNASFQSALGNRKLYVEKNLVAQALSNLLENAVKYSVEGAKILVRGERKDGVGISVTSQGIPISDEDADRIFDRGERGNNAKQNVPAGTGIGLYLASRVMRLHQGKITLDRENDFSRFTLTFPQTRIVS